MKAKIVNGKIAEILVPVNGFSVEDCFHPSVLAQCVDVADAAQVGDDYVPLAPVEPVVEAPTEAPTETTIETTNVEQTQ